MNKSFKGRGCRVDRDQQCWLVSFKQVYPVVHESLAWLCCSERFTSLFC